MNHLAPFEQLPQTLVLGLEGAGLDARAVFDQVIDALAEDLPTSGADVTAPVFAHVLGDETEVTDRVPDGTHVEAGDVVMRVAGPTRGMLTAERTALNFASHLSGVATATTHWVAGLDGTKARVLDTRKTLPNLRALQKYAVHGGGGVNHRFSLTDLDQLRELLDVGCDRSLLDNMSDATMREAVDINAAHPSTRASLEASGGLTLEHARDVAQTGVDFISVGARTHSVIVLDLGMELR